MPSATIGRVPCPECGASARVQRRDGEGKRAYRWCRDCGAQYYPRSEAAEQKLLAAMSAPGDVPKPAPAAPKPTPVRAPKAAAPAPAPDPGPAPSPPAPVPAPARTEGGLFTTIFRR